MDSFLEKNHSLRGAVMVDIDTLVQWMTVRSRGGGMLTEQYVIAVCCVQQLEIPTYSCLVLYIISYIMVQHLTSVFEHLNHFCA